MLYYWHNAPHKKPFPIEKKELKRRS